MKAMGLDVGKRRIGLAVSDPLGMLARPLQTVMSESLNRDVERITTIAHTEQAQVIVVGDPLHMNGDPGKMSVRAHRFGDMLAQVSGLAVVYCDERLTTVEAERILAELGVPPKKWRQQVDAVAASIILQSYLDSQRPPRLPGEPAQDRYR